MRYEITVWKLEGSENRASGKLTCSAATAATALELLDHVIQGIQGHYRAQILDSERMEIIRESFFSFSI